MAPKILIFSIAIGADYSFDIKSGFSIAPAFSLHNNFDIASVWHYFLVVAVVVDNKNKLVWVQWHETNKLETKEYKQQKSTKKTIVSSFE